MFNLPGFNKVADI